MEVVKARITYSLKNEVRLGSPNESRTARPTDPRCSGVELVDMTGPTASYAGGPPVSHIDIAG